MRLERIVALACIVLVGHAVLIPGAALAQEAGIDHEGDALTLEAAPGITVTGETALDGGQAVTVRLRGTGDNPFLRSTETVVSEDGTFSATFNLSAVDAPANGTARVMAGGETLAGPVDVEVVRQQSATGGQPGFGVAAGIAALAVVVLVGWRRR